MLKSARSDLPMQVQRPIAGPAGEAIVTLLTPTGDLLEGDEIDLRVACEPGAEAVLRQASATRLHPCKAGLIRCTAHFEIAHSARLWYLPCELIPFAGTHYCQRVEVDLEAGGEVVAWEVLGPGRLWERDAARRLSLELRVRVGGRLAVADAIRLERPNLTATAGRTHVGSLLLLGPHYAEPDAERLHHAIAEASVTGGASLLPAYGVGARVLGDSADDIFEAFRLACPELRRFGSTV